MRSVATLETRPHASAWTPNDGDHVREVREADGTRVVVGRVTPYRGGWGWRVRRVPARGVGRTRGPLPDLGAALAAADRELAPVFVLDGPPAFAVAAGLAVGDPPDLRSCGLGSGSGRDLPCRKKSSREGLPLDGDPGPAELLGAGFLLLSALPPEALPRALAALRSIALDGVETESARNRNAARAGAAPRLAADGPDLGGRDAPESRARGPATRPPSAPLPFPVTRTGGPADGAR